MAMEVVMMNPPNRRRKSRTLKKNALRRFLGIGKKKLSGYRRGKKRTSLKRLSLSPRIRSKFRRSRSMMRNIGPWQELGGEYSVITAPAPSRMSKTLAAYSAGGLGAVVSGKAPRKPRKTAAKKAGKRKSAKRYGGTRKRTTRKGRTTMAKRRGWRKSSRAHRLAWALGRVGKRRGKSKFSFLRKYGGSKKRIAGYRRRHRMSRARKLSGRAFSFKYKGRRIAANRRRSHRRYANNRGLSTWQKLVKAHGVKGAKRLYRGNRKSRRRSRRSYRRNRETYQIGPVAANRSRRRSHRSYRRNRELYQISPSFSANPTTAALAFPKAVFSVPFIMNNVVPLAAGAIGSKLIGGLLTKYVLKGSQWTDAPWKKAAFVAGSGVLGGLAIGMATKGKKADWAYKFAAGGLAAALITLFDAYMAKTFSAWGMNGIDGYSGGMGYGSDDLKRRIAEELKTELDGVGGFITQEDMDRGISSSSGSVGGFVTSEDLPGEGSSISMDDFAATIAM